MVTCPDDHAPQVAAGLSLGSYNNTQPGENPFDGVVDEVALYADALTADQVTAHYSAGTNDLQSASYASVILADAPVEYLRLGEPAFNPVKNLGSLGDNANGALISAANDQSGPRPAAFTGFEANNAAGGFDGLLGFASLGSPAGLNVAGPVTLEAWVQPAAAQGAVANLIAHGGTDTAAGAVLKLTDGTTYAVGSADDTAAHGTTFAIPAGDLAGNVWVHLAGTYDGTAWKLYRNGALVATTPDAVGAVALPGVDWAVGSRGDGNADAFKGLVDEAAIYNRALTAAQIAAHYNSGVGVAPSVSLARAGAGFTITWAGGTLQAAAEAAGPYINVPNSPTSPLSITPSATRKFFRVLP